MTMNPINRPAIEVEDFSKNYGEFTAVRNRRFTVGPTAVLSRGHLVGCRNGAGVPRMGELLQGTASTRAVVVLPCRVCC